MRNFPIATGYEDIVEVQGFAHNETSYMAPAIFTVSGTAPAGSAVSGSGAVDAASAAQPNPPGLEHAYPAILSKDLFDPDLHLPKFIGPSD